MIRLLKEVLTVIDQHLASTPPSKEKPNVVIEGLMEEVHVDVKRKKLKYSPIYLAEYKELSTHIFKLIDILSLFLQAN